MKLIIEVPLWCPYCGAKHVDETRNGEKWDRRAHTTHRCQKCQRDWDVYVSGSPNDGSPPVAQATAGTPIDFKAAIVKLEQSYRELAESGSSIRVDLTSQSAAFAEALRAALALAS